MMTQDQDTIFAQSEGNAWYRRNAAALSAEGRGDPMLNLAQMLSSERLAAVRSVCDIGCSSGSRLARFAPILPNTARLCGFDASSEAIASGQAMHAGLDLRQGLADAPPFDGPFDLVMIGFVLHWVDRARIAGTIAAIDRLVIDGGIVILSDFLPDRPCARRYHHRDDVALFTYKQDYAKAFTGLGIYHEAARSSFAHDHRDGAISDPADQDRAMAALLFKSLHYPEICG